MLLKHFFVENRSLSYSSEVALQKEKKKEKKSVECSDPSLINMDKALERVCEHPQNMSCYEAGGCCCWIR